MDRSFGDGTAMLRAPDVRISQVDTEIIREQAPFSREIHAPERSLFAFPRHGAFELEIDGNQTRRFVPEGTAIGIEDGRRHRWHALPNEISRDRPSELLLSSIPRRISILQRLNDGIIVVPAEVEPYATLLRLAVDLHITVALMPVALRDEAVIRRCAEICLIQFITFARSAVAGAAPAGLAHDEHLLRAWSAYFADPQRRWTLKALADAAGLGRTTFAQRFRNVFGAPPLQTLTGLRLEQAEAMLRGNTSLIEIAFTVGYNSEAAFVRAFHRHYGMPPGRFRAEQRS